MSTVSAAQAVGEFLQSPDDLLKVVAYRKKLAKEKASIDSKLKSGVKDQLEATRDGLRRLLGTRNNIQAIKDEIVSVEAACRDPQNTVATFDQISRVSFVHRNFVHTEEMVNNLREMYSRLATLEEHLEDDRRHVLGPAPHLLYIHYQLNQLEAFRNVTMHQAKRASADARNTLKRHFERLDRVIEEFEEYIVEMASNLLEIVRAGNAAAVVKLVKIAEMEGKEDEKAIGIKLVKKAAKIDAAAKFKSMFADARRIKHYRSTIMTHVTNSINAKFKDAYERDEQDPTAFLENLGWMYEDLLRVQSDLAPCFPEDWSIFAQYVRKYHKALDTIIRRIVDSDPGASVLLTLHAWLKQYKKDMRELEAEPEWITPALLDGKEQTLIDDYVSLIITKLDEWTANIMKDEVADFQTRVQPPEVDADGLYGMERTVIMWQMVNQQVDLALESGQGAVLAKVVTEANRVIRGTQDQWTKLIDTEWKKQLERPDDVPGGLVEYIIAVANDQIKCADYSEALLARVEDLVSDKYKGVISAQLNNAIDGYLDVAKKCTQALIESIFNDLKPATKQFFTPPWYDGVMGLVVETMRDYMTDYQTYLNPSILDLLVEDLLDTFLITYLTALRRTSKLRMPQAADRIKDDVDEAFQFFSSLKPPEELEASFEVLDMTHALLTASKNLVFLSFWNFAKVHGPNLAFVEALMKARDDLDRSAVSDVMESVKRKVKDENLSDPPEPTIMKKIAVQSVVAAFLSR